MVHQELALAPHLSVEDNIMLGTELQRFGWLRRREQRARVMEVLGMLEHPDIHPDAKVGDLRPTARQLVELARALVGDPQVIIFDEPTSSLTQQDTERLFGIISRLKTRGVSIVYISHFLDEVRRIADRFVVLRNGESVAEGVVAETPNEKIIEQMIGRSVGELYPRIPHTLGEVRLEVQSPTVNFTVHRGEIVGIFGLVGAGRTETLRELFGLDADAWNQLAWRGQSLLHRDCHTRLRSGMGLLSEDRKHEGLMLDQSLEENLTLSELRPYTSAGWLSWSLRRTSTNDWLSRLQVKQQHCTQRARELSGGNQQKLALARLFHQQADLLLLDEPTKGVDIGSKQFIYRLIGEQAAAGKSIIIVSSYLPELMGVCDTLAVMVRGKLSPKYPIAELTEQEAMSLATASV
jgi:ribose transport system ATP-binding protein